MPLEQLLTNSSYTTLPHGFLVLGLMVAAATIGILAGLALNNNEVMIRSRTWLLIIALFSLGTWQPRFTPWLFGFISFLALREFITLLETRPTDRGALFWLFPAIVIQYCWVGMQWYGMFIIFIPVWLFLFIPLRLVLAGETAGFIRSAGVINWVAMMTIFSLSHVAFLMQLKVPGVGHGLGYVLSLVIMTALNDVFQFIWGKLLGGPKIIPAVSPGKTWSGFLGGMATSALLASFLLPLLTPYGRLAGAGVGALLAGCGFIGDLVESAVKRDIGVKDSGSSLPGHGGILDRVDSLTYTAPVFFHLTWYLFH